MDRKRELKRQYKQTMPEMGLFIVRCKKNNKVYVQPTNDIRTVKNGILVRLKGGTHPNRELQKEWDEYREDAFEMEILDRFETDDRDKTDFKEDLATLQSMWETELIGQGKAIYQKRLPK